MLPGRQLAAPSRRENLATLVDNFSTADRYDRPARNLPPRKDRELAVPQFVLIANGSLQVGIPDYDITIRPHRDRPLAWVQAKELGRVRRGQRDHPLERNSSRAHALGVQQWQLDLEVVRSSSMVDDIERRIEFFLACISDVIRIDDVACVPGDCTPKVVRITLLAQWRLTYVNRAVGFVKTFLCQVQVQKPHFGEDR